MVLQNLKIWAIVLVFLGELFAVYAETFGTKFNLWSDGFWKMFFIMIISGFLLVVGYLVGFKAYQNLWVITVISLTTLLIAEPFIIVVFFHQTPTIGAIIGFVLGIIGLVASIFY